MGKISWVFDDSDLPVYHKFPLEISGQPAYLEIDPKDCRIDAESDGEIGGGVPESVWNGRQMRLEIPANVTRHGLQRLASDPEANRLAENLIESYTEDWDGSNYVGHWDTELVLKFQNFLDNFWDLCPTEDPKSDMAVVWDFEDWIGDEYNGESAEELIEIARNMNVYFTNPRDIPEIINRLKSFSDE